MIVVKSKKFQKAFVFSLLLVFSAETLFAQKGEKLWSLKIPGKNIDASAAVGDVDRDGLQDVVVGSLTGDVIAIDGYGRVIWDRNIGNRITTAPTVMNVTGDDGLEVLALTDSGRLFCLDGLTGDVLWSDSSLGTIKWGCMTVVVADINGNAKKEIITADESGKLICLNGKGRKLWEYNEPEGIGSAPAVGDLDGDGKAEVVIALEKSPLICLNHKGKELWRYRPEGDVLQDGRKTEVAAPVIWDIDGDGKSEVITGMGFQLAVVSSDGKLLWSFPMKNRIDSGISVADAVGDGNGEIYAVDLSGYLVCVDAEGKMKWESRLSKRARRSPVIIDIDGDGTVEILVAGYGSKLMVFDPAGEVKQEIGITSGTNASPAVADMLEDGGLCIVLPEISGNVLAYHWPNSVKNAKMPWPEYRAGASRSASVLAGKERSKVTVDLKAYRVGKDVLQNDLHAVSKMRDEMNSLIPKLKDKKGVDEKVYYLGGKFAEAEKQFAKIDEMSPVKKRKLRDDLTNLKSEFVRLSKIMKEAVRQGRIIVAYGANPWAPFGGTEEILEGRTSAAIDTVEALGGEFESAAFNIFNFGGSTRTLRVEIEGLKGPEGAAPVPADSVLTLCEVVDVPTHDADLAADALPELNGGSLLVVPAWQGRQLWITINTKKLAPGTWKAKLKFRSLNVEPQEAEAEVSIRVWDVSLPEHNPLTLCHWGSTEVPKGAFADQIAHGTNVFPRTVPPIAEFDENGKIIKIDYTAHDAFMKTHAPKGILLFMSLVSLHGPAPAFSDAWLKAYRSFIPQWIKHLQEQGYDYDNFAFYPVDEPGVEHGRNVARFLKWAELIHSIDPKIRMYADLAPAITMEQLKAMAPYVDIYAPMQTYNFPKEQLDFIHSTNSIRWNYDPSDDAKHLSPLAYYRGQAWMVWKYGHTGIGFWTYYQGPEFWFQPVQGNDYAMIYEGKGVVTSKRWEAVRDGVEDFALLNALKTATDSIKKTGGNDEFVKEARTILEERASGIGDFIKNNKPELRGGDYARKLADARLKKLREIRADIARLLNELQQK